MCRETGKIIDRSSQLTALHVCILYMSMYRFYTKFVTPLGSAMTCLNHTTNVGLNYFLLPFYLNWINIGKNAVTFFPNCESQKRVWMVCLFVLCIMQVGLVLGCIHLLNTRKYCDNTRKYCGNTHEYWPNTWKICSPASVILASIGTILVSFWRNLKRISVIINFKGQF